MGPLLERFTSRKFLAFIAGLCAATAYSLGGIDEKGLAAISAVVAAYNVGEGLADFKQNAAIATAKAQATENELDRDFEYAQELRARSETSPAWGRKVND